MTKCELVVEELVERARLAQLLELVEVAHELVLHTQSLEDTLCSSANINEEQWGLAGTGTSEQGIARLLGHVHIDGGPRLEVIKRWVSRSPICQTTKSGRWWRPRADIQSWSF
jgi:hypothetical protein